MEEMVHSNTPDGATRVVTDIVLDNATRIELERYIKHFASEEAWLVMYHCVRQDVIQTPRHILQSRHTVREKFLELIKDPNMIAQSRTRGEKIHSPVSIDAMLRADYRGTYPHFLLVLARQFMIVETYPSVEFVWVTGWPTNFPEALITYPWASDYHRLCQASAEYYSATKEIRDYLIPVSTETLRERSQQFLVVCNETPEFSLRRACTTSQ